VLVRIVPDTNAVNVRADAVLLHFDEVISERPGSATGQGATERGAIGAGAAGAGAAATGLAAIVNISPSDGRERVVWRRTAIEIRPRRGFRPNTTYRVTLLPGLADLRGNVLRTPTEFVFSTGTEIPTGRIAGTIFDWAAARPAALARVEVFPPADSSVRWGARADSSGRFTVRDLAPGTYAVRAWLDSDSDRRLGVRESFDSTTVALDRLGTVELYAFVHDTLSPRLESVELADSVTLRVRFDRVVAAEWDPAGAVSFVGADSVVRPLATFVPRDRLDSLRRAAVDALAADTIAADPAAADTIAADSVRADTVTVDSTAVPAPIFGRATPVQTWAASLDTVLAPGLYRLRVTNVRGLNSITRDTEREFRVREPPPPPTPPVTPPPVTPPPAADTSARRPR
jgi:hypothetical protein